MSWPLCQGLPPNSPIAFAPKHHYGSWFMVLCSLFFVLCSLFMVLCSLFMVLCSLFFVHGSSTNQQPKNPYPTTNNNPPNPPSTGGNQQPTFRFPRPDPTPLPEGFPLPTTSFGTGMDPVALISPLISPPGSRKNQPRANGLAKPLALFWGDRPKVPHSQPIAVEQI